MGKISSSAQSSQCNLLKLCCPSVQSMKPASDYLSARRAAFHQSEYSRPATILLNYAPLM